MRATHSLLSAVVDLLAPVRCPGCDLAVGAAERPFCAGCLPLLDRPDASLCPPHASAAVYLYGGPIADALLRLKYAGRTELAPALGALLANAALAYAGQVDCVMPLPLHPSRLRVRGYNQSALLARPVAAALGVPLDVRTLRRVRPTRDQAGLPREGRAENVRAAFRAQGPRTGRVLLIDDVRTTGATLAAGGEALLDAGYSGVITLALARAEG